LRFEITSRGAASSSRLPGPGPIPKGRRRRRS